MASQTLTIRRPDDWHVHLRDGEMLKAVAPYTARQFARAIIMPNLMPPITTLEAASAYRERIIAAAGARFHAADDLLPDRYADPTSSRAASRRTSWVAAKLYPAGATTNSASGVTDVRNIYPRARGDAGDRHGALRPWRGDRPRRRRFDREAVFIERVLDAVTRDFPS